MRLVGGNETWQYRQGIGISNGTGTIQSNYPLQLSINTSALVTAGKLLSTCNDLRFVDSNGHQLEYFVSNCNANPTNLWVQIISFPLGTSTIYMYYGNSSAPAKSNSAATFDATENTTGGAANYSNLLTSVAVSLIGNSSPVTAQSSNMLQFIGTNYATVGNHYAYYLVNGIGSTYSYGYVIQNNDALNFLQYDIGNSGCGIEIGFY